MISHEKADELFNDFVDFHDALHDLTAIIAERSSNMHSDGNPSLFLYVRYLEGLNQRLYHVLKELSDHSAETADASSGGAAPASQSADDNH